MGIEHVTPPEAAARIRELADVARSRVRADAIDAARRVEAVAASARLWLESSAERVRRDLAARVEAAEQTGPVPSLFKVMGAEHRERPFNNVLAWLCNPGAEHGVGALVLRAIAEMLGVTELVEDLRRDPGRVQVVPEGWPLGFAGHGYPDLVIAAPSVFVLIENKVWSPESGEDQYAGYGASIQALARLHSRKWRSYLLARDQRSSPGAGEDAWNGAHTHAELVAAIRAVANDPVVSAWGRVLCLLAAEELSPVSPQDGALGRARDLLHLTAERPGVEHLAEMRHLSATLTVPPHPVRPDLR